MALRRASKVGCARGRPVWHRGRRDRATRHCATRCAHVFLLLAALALPVNAQTRSPLEEAEALNARVIELYNAGKGGEAIPLAERALALRQAALPAGHPDIAQSLNNLAFLYQAQGRYGEAEPLYKQALALRQAALPAGHPDIALSLNNLAALYDTQGRYGDAEPLYKQALALNQAALPAGHPDIARSLNNLAALYLMQRDGARAGDYWRRSTAILVERARREAAAPGEALRGRGKGETAQNDWQFWGFIKVSYRHAAERRELAGATRETFVAAQWARGSEAAGALAEAAARSGSGDPVLAALVRERQDAVARWRGLEAQVIAAHVSGGPKAELAAQVKAVEDRVAAIDTTLKARFPEFASLSFPEPLSVEDVQAQLGEGEALVLILDTAEWKPVMEEETFFWIVTRTDARWLRSGLGSTALAEQVAALRCGLDQVGEWSWNGGKQRWLANRPHCAALAPDGFAADARPPYDLARAHALYRSLLGEADDLLRGKHLLVVPSGALQSLPLHALVTAPPPEPLPKSAAGYRAARFLAQDNAITVLPSVASLKALRGPWRKGAPAPEPYIGFGDPKLDGTPDCGAAPRLTSCPGEAVAAAKPAAPAAGRVKTMLAAVIEKLSKRGVADVAQVRAMCPLPETADEMGCVATSLGAPASRVITGAAATEPAVKAAPLERYRVIHFATHGVLAGEAEAILKSGAEPGLVLTPPPAASADNDGLLTASEVAGLKLNADWVILSACNTAAGEKGGADSLSGLARAFFYAGARALLVSHWYVDSEASVKLVTRTFAEMRRDDGIGRAEAFRRAMSHLIEADAPHAAHPSIWAPFIVVGEGAR